VGAVNVADLRKKEGPGVWDGAAVGVVLSGKRVDCWIVVYKQAQEDLYEDCA
jgi:hypothetical protein